MKGSYAGDREDVMKVMGYGVAEDECMVVLGVVVVMAVVHSRSIGNGYKKRWARCSSRPVLPAVLT